MLLKYKIQTHVTIRPVDDAEGKRKYDEDNNTYYFRNKRIVETSDQGIKAPNESTKKHQEGNKELEEDTGKIYPETESNPPVQDNVETPTTPDQLNLLENETQSVELHEQQKTDLLNNGTSLESKLIPELQMLDEDRNANTLLTMFLKYKIQTHVTIRPVDDAKAKKRYDEDNNTYYFRKEKIVKTNDHVIKALKESTQKHQKGNKEVEEDTETIQLETENNPPIQENVETLTTPNQLNLLENEIQSVEPHEQQHSEATNQKRRHTNKRIEKLADGSTGRRPSVSEIEKMKLVSNNKDQAQVNKLKNANDTELVKLIQMTRGDDFVDWRKRVKEAILTLWSGLKTPNKEDSLTKAAMQLVVVFHSDAIPEISCPNESPSKTATHQILKEFHKDRNKQRLIDETARIFKKSKYKNLADTKLRLSGLMARCLHNYNSAG